MNETPANIDMLSVHKRNAGKCIPTCRKSLRLNRNEGVVIQQKQLTLFQRLLELAENNEQTPELHKSILESVDEFLTLQQHRKMEVPTFQSGGNPCFPTPEGS